MTFNVRVNTTHPAQLVISRGKGADVTASVRLTRGTGTRSQRAIRAGANGLMIFVTWAAALALDTWWATAIICAFSVVLIADGVVEARSRVEVDPPADLRIGQVEVTRLLDPTDPADD